MVGNVITVRIDDDRLVTEYVNIYTGETSSDPKGVPLISKEDFLLFKDKIDMPIAFVRKEEI